jgi:hypothetical protein
MLGPVSGTGRAMMASLQQAMSKGMPVDQAVQYVKSMATQGVAPMADLYAMMNQFQRLKQQPVQAPQTPPTIRDQLNMAEQQQMAMQQGLGGLPAPSMEQAQFAGGGIVAFAEGGTPYDIEGIYERGKPRADDIFDPAKLSIFAERAGTEDLARLYAMSLSRNDVDTASRLEPYLMRKGVSGSQLNEIKKKTAQGVAAVKEGTLAGEREAETQEFLTGKPAPTQTAVPPVAPKPDAAPPAPERRPPVARRSADIGAAAAPAEATVAAKKMGFEDFLAPLREAGKPLREATDAYRQFLDKDEASAKEQSSRDRMLALAQAGFGMAEAASKPGATFLGSAAAAGGSYAKNMMQLNREADAAKRGIVKERLALAQAEAAGNKADYVAAYQNLNEYEKRLTQIDQFNQGMRLQQAKLALDRTLGMGQIQASIANAAATLGLRQEELAARIENNKNQLALQIEQLVTENMKPLLLDPAYRDGTPEQRATIESNVRNSVTQRVVMNSIGAMGGTTSDAVSAADRIVGIGGTR